MQIHACISHNMRCHSKKRETKNKTTYKYIHTYHINEETVRISVHRLCNLCSMLSKCANVFSHCIVLLWIRGSKCRAIQWMLWRKKLHSSSFSFIHSVSHSFVCSLFRSYVDSVIRLFVNSNFYLFHHSGIHSFGIHFILCKKFGIHVHATTVSVNWAHTQWALEQRTHPHHGAFKMCE